MFDVSTTAGVPGYGAAGTGAGEAVVCFVTARAPWSSYATTIVAVTIAIAMPTNTIVRRLGVMPPAARSTSRCEDPSGRARREWSGAHRASLGAPRAD